MGEETYFLIQTHHYFPKATGLPPTHFLNWLVVQINNQPAVLLQTPRPALTTPVMVRFSTRALPSPVGPVSATIWVYQKYLKYLAGKLLPLVENLFQIEATIWGKHVKCQTPTIRCPRVFRACAGFCIEGIFYEWFHFNCGSKSQGVNVPGSILNGWSWGGPRSSKPVVTCQKHFLPVVSFRLDFIVKSIVIRCFHHMPVQCAFCATSIHSKSG